MPNLTADEFVRRLNYVNEREGKPPVATDADIASLQEVALDDAEAISLDIDLIADLISLLRDRLPVRKLDLKRAKYLTGGTDTPPQVSVEEMTRRHQELSAVVDGKPEDGKEPLPPGFYRWKHGSLDDSIAAARRGISGGHVFSPNGRTTPEEELEHLLYLRGDLMQHSLIHGTPAPTF